MCEARACSSNEYPQSMFWSKNKKNRYTPVYPLYYITVRFNGVYMLRAYYPYDHDHELDLIINMLRAEVVLGFPRRSDTNQPVQSQKNARSLNFGQSRGGIVLSV